MRDMPMDIFFTKKPVIEKLCTDNQSVVHSLKSRETTNKTIHELKSRLNQKIQENDVQITIKWIKAHVGFPGNEYADELAKKGTEIRPYGPEPIIPVNKQTIHNEIRNEVNRQWEERWLSRKDSRQTAIFFPSLNPKKSEEITKLHKNTIGPVVRALTGHDHRNRHKMLLEGADIGMCRLCSKNLETSSHIILHCPRLTQLRAQIFKTYQADIIVQSWETKQLVTFLTVEHIAAMEQGD